MTAGTGTSSSPQDSAWPQSGRSPLVDDLPDRPDGPPFGERITAILIPQAVDDLKHLQDATGLSRADIANRAITLYRFINDELCTGRDVLIRDTGSGETWVLELLDARTDYGGR